MQLVPHRIVGRVHSSVYRSPFFPTGGFDFRRISLSREDSPLLAQLSPLFQHEGENTLPALPPPLARDPGHYSPTKGAALLIGKTSILAGVPGVASPLASRASLFPYRDRAMGAPEDLEREPFGV